MRLPRPILAAACGFALAVPLLGGTAEARDRRDRPGDFDFYLMVFSLAPSFCALSGAAQGKRQCDDPSDAAYRATPLTVHGLWPNRKGVSVNRQPQSCSTERLSLSPALRRKLAVYMPGIADGLERHEWEKHGVCSGLTPEAYFGKVVAIAEEANATIGAVLREKGLLGREVPIRTLLQGVAEKNRALADAIVVDCKFARQQRGGPGGGPRAYVAEIRVLISREIGSDPDHDGWPGTFVPLREAGFQANSGCPGGAGFIPAGFGP
jgi:ribonuclease T2